MLKRYILTLAAGLSLPVFADEGVWLWDQTPRAAIARKYGVQLSDELLRHLRLSAVRFNSGGTGSFVSPGGLLFTNHHVGLDCIHKLSSAAQDYVANGFSAARREDERACPDLEVNVLVEFSDVTAKVTAGTANLPAAAANQRKKAASTEIEKACQQASGNRCDVVAMYAGGKYYLYQHRKYTDIRLVFAPEAGIAAFGGDPDNFTYPRHCLDISFFRAYEQGKPARVGHYFKWSKEGARNGDMIMVAGNPGATGRLATMAQLEFLANTSYPFLHRYLEARIAAIQAFGAADKEQARSAQEALLGAQNSYKAYTGFLRGLRDTALMDAKRADERKLREFTARDPQRREEFARFWDDLATAYAEYARIYKPYTLLERYGASASSLLGIARDVVRLAEERTKPDGDRLREYASSGLASLEQGLYSDAPVYERLEIALLTFYLEYMQQELGAGDPTVKAVLAGRTPAAAARAAVTGSKLAQVAERKRLAADRKAVAASQDGMIRLALALDARARLLRKEYEDKIEAVTNAANAKIAAARFALNPNEYPDANFTLRFGYGAVKGYRNDAGENIPWATTYASLYAWALEHGNRDPFELPLRWVHAQRKLNLATQFNFAATADIHGGNSGSATVNKDGEIVGIVFDSNLEALPNRFVYREQQERSVHVASQGIIEALRTVYAATALLKELGF